MYLPFPFRPTFAIWTARPSFSLQDRWSKASGGWATARESLNNNSCARHAGGALKFVWVCKCVCIYVFMWICVYIFACAPARRGWWSVPKNGGKILFYRQVLTPVIYWSPPFPCPLHPIAHTWAPHVPMFCPVSCLSPWNRSAVKQVGTLQPGKVAITQIFGIGLSLEYVNKCLFSIRWAGEEFKVPSKQNRSLTKLKTHFSINAWVLKNLESKGGAIRPAVRWGRAGTWKFSNQGCLVHI